MCEEESDVKSGSPLLNWDSSTDGHANLQRVSLAFVHECHRPRTFRVAGLQLGQPKPGGANHLVYRPIEMAASANPFPQWRQSVLPTNDVRLRGQAVFRKYEASVRLQYAPYLVECFRQIRDGAERPCGDHRVHRAIRQWDRFGCSFDQLDRTRSITG